MKKFYLLLVSLLLVAMISTGVFASGSLSAAVSASKSEVYRSDEIVVTVSVGKTTGDMGGISVAYNSAALELTGYEWLLAGAESRFNATQLKGVFAYETAQTISGNFFKCVFKVREDATFYPTEIAFTVKVGDQTVEAKTSVTVVCNHNYGGWISDGEHTHTHTCTICSGVETVEHTWDSGKIDPAPTCTAEGVKTYTCTGCGERKTEAVPMIDHSWDAGTVTKKTSCSEEGEKTYKCTGCDATRTETIAKSKHKYDNSCDTTCNACGSERQTTHKYADQWTTDGTGHWHQCTICGHRKDEAAHKPGPEPTEQTSQNCTVCGYIIKEALGHTHDYQVEWSADGQGHWHACSGCENKSEYQEHVFDNTCDGNCNICGYERETEHIYYENYMSSQDGHWHECRVCGYQLEMEHHTPNAEGMCTACGYQGTAADHTHSYPEKWQWDVTGHWQECECGEHSSIQSHTWDDGEIIKKPTDTTDGARTYKCTVCGAEKTELIPAGTVVTDSFPWMVLLIVGGVLILGVIAYIVFGMVASKRESGKYSESADQSTEPEHSDVT